MRPRPTERSCFHMSHALRPTERWRAEVNHCPANILSGPCSPRQATFHQSLICVKNLAFRFDYLVHRSNRVTRQCEWLVRHRRSRTMRRISLRRAPGSARGSGYPIHYQGSCDGSGKVDRRQIIATVNRIGKGLRAGRRSGFSDCL